MADYLRPRCQRFVSDTWQPLFPLAAEEGWELAEQLTRDFSGL